MQNLNCNLHNLHKNEECVLHGAVFEEGLEIAAGTESWPICTGYWLVSGPSSQCWFWLMWVRATIHQGPPLPKWTNSDPVFFTWGPSLCALSERCVESGNKRTGLFSGGSYGGNPWHHLSVFGCQDLDLLILYRWRWICMYVCIILLYITCGTEDVLSLLLMLIHL